MNEENAENVREFLKNVVLTKVTQSEIARRTSLHQSYLSEVLNKKRDPTYKLVHELAELMNTPSEVILRGDKELEYVVSLGETQGYRAAERAIKHARLIELTTDEWLAVRDTTVPIPFRRLTPEILYMIARACKQAWEVD